jgi:signal transduction histidine kinase
LSALRTDPAYSPNPSKGLNVGHPAPSPASFDAAHLATLIAVQQEITAAGLDLQRVMSLTTQRAQGLTGADGAAVELAEGGELVYRAAAGLATPHLGLRLSLDGSISGRCVRLGEVLRCDDSETDSRVDREACRRVGLRSLVVVPLRHGGKVVGVLKVLSARPGAFTDRDSATLQLLAGFLAAAVSNAAAFEAERALVERRTAELRQRAEELAAADRRKDQFLAMLAHELRNPLAPIRNALQVARLSGSEDPKLAWAGDVIERQVQQLTRLVEDLLDVSRLNQGKARLRKEAVDLTAVVNQAVETSRPLLEARRHTLSVTLPPRPLRVQADPARLAQVLCNLLNNAAKYTEPGEQVWLTVGPEDDEAVLRVEDTGIGIPEEMLPRVFDLFTQVDSSQARAQGGLGIGLTLVRSLVEMHGGTVEARSDGPGRGSEFVVRLPILVAEPDTISDCQAKDAEDPPDTCRRILVVDDSRDAAESLAILLRLTGHDVRTAHDGPEALEAARSFEPEVVLLDIGLPGMSGYEVARRLREQAGTDPPHLVALTGYSQEEDRQRSREAGFDLHLVKPVDPSALRDLLSFPSPLRQEVVRGGPGVSSV